MPVPQTEAALKSYFEAGDVPSQAQFAEFIGTMFYLYNQAVAAAAAATAAAEAAEAALADRGVIAFGRVRNNGSGYVVDREVGCNVAVSAVGTAVTVTATFNSAMANNRYLVAVDWNTVQSVTRNNASVVIVLALSDMNLNGKFIEFMVHS